MAYADHFALVDDLLPHLDATVQGGLDPFVASRYAGFLSLSAATVLELCVKQILVEHAESISPVFGSFVAKTYERLNGRVKLRALKDEHLPRFGARYCSHFSRLLKRTESLSLTARHRSITQSYDNVISWRHGFAHEGVVPTQATYAEVRDAYSDAKVVVDCLARTLSRTR